MYATKYTPHVAMEPNNPGIIPLNREVIPSDTAILIRAPPVLLYFGIPEIFALCACILVMTTSNGWVTRELTRPAAVPATKLERRDCSVASGLSIDVLTSELATAIPPQRKNFGRDFTLFFIFWPPVSSQVFGAMSQYNLVVLLQVKCIALPLPSHCPRIANRSAPGATAST